MTNLGVWIRIAGMALADKKRRALYERGRILAAYRVGKISNRLFARRPYLCTCRCCRASGITHPTALRAAGFVNLRRVEVARWRL